VPLKLRDQLASARSWRRIGHQPTRLSRELLFELIEELFVEKSVCAVSVHRPPLYSTVRARGLHPHRLLASRLRFRLDAIAARAQLRLPPSMQSGNRSGVPDALAWLLRGRAGVELGSPHDAAAEHLHGFPGRARGDVVRLGAQPPAQDGERGYA
jgi:hypothetical protein